MKTLQDLIEFLNRLEEKKIFYQLNKIRDSILIEVAVPGQRWEIEFMYDGGIEIEKFITTTHLYGESEIGELFKDFSE